MTHSQHSIRALDLLFQTPIFAASLFTDNEHIPRPSATRILGILRESGLLVTLQEAKGRRPGIYAFRELVNVAEGKEVI